jgi:hypothetical protein
VTTQATQLRIRIFSQSTNAISGEPWLHPDDLAGMPSEEMILGETAKCEWNKAVADYQVKYSSTWTEAMAAVRKEQLGLFEAYQSVALPSPVLRGRTV